MHISAAGKQFIASVNSVLNKNLNSRMIVLIYLFLTCDKNKRHEKYIMTPVPDEKIDFILYVFALLMLHFVIQL